MGDSSDQVDGTIDGLQLVQELGETLLPGLAQPVVTTKAAADFLLAGGEEAFGLKPMEYRVDAAFAELDAPLSGLRDFADQLVAIQLSGGELPEDQKFGKSVGECMHHDTTRGYLMSLGVKPNLHRYRTYSPLFLLPTATSLALSLPLALTLTLALALP
jgi:hypothetical protein